MLQELTVELGARSYPIRIGRGGLESLGAFCRERGLRGACLVVADENVDRLHGARCLEALRCAGYAAEKAVVPAGEPSKSGDCLFQLYRAAIQAGLDRRSFVVALGGGVVGDLAGFMAATFLRGLPYVQVPTTVVAMVDSAVGGKTGINLPEGKNLVGSFHQPVGVAVDLDLLATLPQREYVSGLAEVIKYGVIRDRAFFDRLEGGVKPLLAREPELLAEAVARSCAIKAEVVGEDETEGGVRAILNFGHTLGHAIEKVSGYGRYLHGEAIGIGMRYAADLSVRERGLPEDEARRIGDLVSAVGLPVKAPELDWEALCAAMAVDKKSVGRMPRFVLAERIGHVAFGCEVGADRLKEVWRGLGE